jgi:predicted NBD/HSP70 family sugar kinase
VIPSGSAIQRNSAVSSTSNNGLPLPPPQVRPVLDDSFRPAVLAKRGFEAAAAAGASQPLRIALEQTDGSVFHYETRIFSDNAPGAAGNFAHVERLIKFLLWAWGGWRILVEGNASLAGQLQKYFHDTATGRFDSELIGEKIYGHPIKVVATHELPPSRAVSKPLGRHLNGCRIGFDLGGSDRKVAAVIDGKVVFSEETVWDPYFHPDPQYHFDGVMDSLKRAAAHLPRIDAIGGSAAGCYVNNRVKAASLFRGVPPDAFNRRVKDLFLEVQRAMGGVPLEVVNDGEVTALAGSMSLGKNAVLGLAFGTSLAAGYVTREGNITSWLNELAFAPVDYNPDAPRDEWSGDYGVGAQYFSQQAVGRLLAPAGIEVDAKMPLPEKLKHVQSLMAQGDARARKIYQTIGAYLGHAIAHYAEFYDFDHVLILGRVTTGEGGDVIVKGAAEVLRLAFPNLAERIAFHMPDEKDKRHGQAVAAASLPSVKSE